MEGRERRKREREIEGDRDTVTDKEVVKDGGFLF